MLSDIQDAAVSSFILRQLQFVKIFLHWIGDMFTEEQNELVESAAEMLYGLIHVRYILTTKGMAAMLEKYKNYDFGRCPRAYCSGQPCLPVGQSDIPRSSTVKIYCPKCEDIYYPRSKYQGNIDGAYFGTTFPHLFLMTYGHLKPQKPTQNYTPRVFGFKIHKTWQWSRCEEIIFSASNDSYLAFDVQFVMVEAVEAEELLIMMKDCSSSMKGSLGQSVKWNLFPKYRRKFTRAL